MYPIEHVVDLEAEQQHLKNGGKERKIPLIVHMTGKTSCLTKAFQQNMKRWSFANHSFYFHDDEAVNKLIMEKEWPMFPQLRHTMECLENAGGAAKADLWRYLVLWEYGGLYVDMDSGPGNVWLQQDY